MKQNYPILYTHAIYIRNINPKGLRSKGRKKNSLKFFSFHSSCFRLKGLFVTFNIFHVLVNKRTLMKSVVLDISLKIWSKLCIKTREKESFHQEKLLLKKENSRRYEEENIYDEKVVFEGWQRDGDEDVRMKRFSFSQRPSWKRIETFLVSNLCHIEAFVSQ